MITIKNLSKVVDGKTILKNINLNIKYGETTVIIGPSGSGKSTLLRCINMLEIPTSGQIIVDGQEITNNGIKIEYLRQKVGMVFQHFNIFSNMNVINNIILAPQKIQRVSRLASIRRAYKLLNMVNLEDKARNMPHILSGGQKQRLAIARALATNPKYLLFDEPTSALDPEMVQDVLNVIKKLSKNITSIIVSHEMGFVRSIADKIIFVENGEILEHSTTAKFFDVDHQNPRIKNFLDKIQR